MIAHFRPHTSSCLCVPVQALETLSLADNQLTDLPDGISRLALLKQLWVYGNQLQDLPDDILKLPAIKSKLFLLCAVEL